jgi:hypothetical protein
MEKAESIYRAKDKKFVWYDIYTWKDGCVVCEFIIVIFVNLLLLFPADIVTRSSLVLHT